MKKYLLLFIFLQACVSKLPLLPPKAANVQFLKETNTILQSCKKLGPISAAGDGTDKLEYAIEDAAYKLRLIAADMDADTVVITSRDGDDIFKANLQAIAFRCH